MVRSPRIVIPGVPHHVTQRGNNCQDVFLRPEDRSMYLKALSRYAGKYELDILGYCLMTNHVHLLVTPRSEESLSLGMGQTHWRYSQAFNRFHDRSGHLWQGRFYSCPLDDVHAYRTLSYIETNPVRARIVRKAWDYPWSSAQCHVGMDDPPRWLKMAPWSEWSNPKEWKGQLEIKPEDTYLEAIHRHTLRGHPLGNDGFISRLEKKLGCRLRPRPIGRPSVSVFERSCS